ncbi:MAG: HDOD domain-containing protein [Pseudomonadota bacterium]
MEIREIVGNVRSIFSLPEAVIRINELIESGDTCNNEIERVILNDPALTAKLLKFANSTYFGFSGKVDTVQRAVSIIGHKELRNLAIAASVTTTFKDIPSDLLNMDTFWQHSVACGVIARLLASNVENRERFFIAGLLHAVGRLILLHQFPKESAKALGLLNEGEEAVLNAERKTFGFIHPNLGAELLREWKLPPDICKMVELQFEVMLDTRDKFDASTLNAAVGIANFMQPYTSQKIDSEKSVSKCTFEAWDFLGLTPELIESIITVAKLQVIELTNMIK